MSIRHVKFDIPLYSADRRLLRYVSRDEAARMLAAGSWRETMTPFRCYAVEERA